MIAVVFFMGLAMIPLFIVFSSSWVYILVCTAIIVLLSLFIVYDT